MMLFLHFLIPLLPVTYCIPQSWNPNLTERQLSNPDSSFCKTYCQDRSPPSGFYGAIISHICNILTGKKTGAEKLLIPSPVESLLPAETPTGNPDTEEEPVPNQYLPIPPNTEIWKRFLVNWYQGAPKECKKYLDPSNIRIACKKLGFIVKEYESSIPRLENEWVPERRKCFRYPPVLAVMWACVRTLHYEYETGRELFPPLPALAAAGEHDVDLVEFGCESGEKVCGHEGMNYTLYYLFLCEDLDADQNMIAMYSTKRRIHFTSAIIEYIWRRFTRWRIYLRSRCISRPYGGLALGAGKSMFELHTCVARHRSRL